MTPEMTSRLRSLTEAAGPAGCSERPSSEAAASEEARRTLQYVESLSDARTPLAGFVNSLLGAYALAHRGRLAAMWTKGKKLTNRSINQRGGENLHRGRWYSVTYETALTESVS